MKTENNPQISSVGIKDRAHNSFDTSYMMMQELRLNSVRSAASSEWHGIAAQKLKPSLYAYCGKRCLDVLIAFVLCVLLSPVFIVVGIAVRIALGPGIFYSQTRVGRYGETFEILKFRTMLKERRKKDVATDNDRRISGHKTDSDPRHTKLGIKLRKFGLDELPQLLNVRGLA